MAQTSTTTRVVRDHPSRPAAEGMFAALHTTGYPLLWASGWLWSFTRWMAVFLCSYLVNRLTGSPLLVQLVGTAFFAPMFFGGMLGGVVSDRFDRRGTIMKQLAALVPVALAMAALVLSGHVRVWMVYLFMLAIGVGGVLDMTSRRALVYDMVGGEGITNAMALESVAQTGGTMLGTLVGGAVINFVGTGQAFVVIAVAYAGSWLCLALMPPVPREATAAPAGERSLRREIGEGLRYVRGRRLIISILGVTMLMNFFYFSYMPSVPVFADRLHVNAFWAGVLASAAGLGSLVGAAAIAAQARPRRGLLYMAGSGLALAGLFVFAASTWYPLALAALIVAGLGQSGFGTMQGSLILTASGPEMRGRVMGVLSMGIGVLPFGMALLGVAAQLAGAPAAVMASVAIGLLGLCAWATRSPDLRRA